MPVEKTSKKLIWFRHNLRTHDVGYWQNISKNDEVVAVYCIEPNWLQETHYGWKKMEKFRAHFLLETLQNLKNQLHKFNVNLYVFIESASSVLPKIYDEFAFETVLSNVEFTSEELKIENQIKQTLPQVTFITTPDQFLITPNQLPFSVENLPEVFTSFRKQVEKRMQILSEIFPKKIEHFTEIPFSSNIPTLENLGYDAVDKDKRTAFPLKGGEESALNHLENYTFNTEQIATYKETRNELVGVDFSTKFSPWLANGSLSARKIYREIKEFENQVVENESTYWVIFELFWRDFFKYIALKHKNKLFKQTGILEKNYRWRNNKQDIENWINGDTQYDFVNANMIEMQQTGWMSNRGRQNVASFFAKEQELDWRIGASYFEAMLIDYDVHSNYGNWNYLAGVGNDPRDRKFNINMQAENYDKDRKFRKLWLVD
jgi:deoxyribodipyrimidine photo-lyase